ncbi:MAG: hypothetical protein RLZZ70_21 [Candidatus Parcubacteria bacterium]|jgi:hypothetical protein
MTEPKDISEVSMELYKKLSPYTQEERHRITQAVMILLGDNNGQNSRSLTSLTSVTKIIGAQQDLTSAREFFAEKNPQNKGEELAVAARYIELSEQLEEYSKAEIKAVFAEARKNFDDKNFGRDIDNAKRQAGLFISGTGRDANKLSYAGQQFVDALPDREAAAKYRRAKKSKGVKKSTKDKDKIN